MDLNSKIMTVVHGGVRDALAAAQDKWRKTPELNNAAMLTGTHVKTNSTGARAEMTFETHASVVPQGQRDMYGVSTGTRAVPLANMHGPKASVPKLMRDTKQALTDGFLASLDDGTGPEN